MDGTADYLDVAALSDRFGAASIGAVLAGLGRRRGGVPTARRVRDLRGGHRDAEVPQHRRDAGRPGFGVGFDGMLAAIDCGYARDWRKLVAAIAADPELREVFEEAKDAAESRSTVLLLERVLARETATPGERALERLKDAYRGTRMTQGNWLRPSAPPEPT